MMSYSVIPITAPSTSLTRNQQFSITICEKHCANCKWVVDIPTSIEVIAVNDYVQSGFNHREWILEGHLPGTYTLQFNFKKSCCGRPTLLAETYTIIIV